MGAKASLPVDAGGNPWNGSWVYDHGNLAANLLNNVVLESTGVLQKSRIYEMSSNKTLRETIAFLIVRDNAHQNAFTKALETLGVDWGKLFPIPNYDLNKYPECRKYVEMGFHNAQFNFRLDNTLIGEIFTGTTPSRNDGELWSQNHQKDIQYQKCLTCQMNMLLVFMTLIIRNLSLHRLSFLYNTII